MLKRPTRALIRNLKGEGYDDMDIELAYAMQQAQQRNNEFVQDFRGIVTGVKPQSNRTVEVKNNQATTSNSKTHNEYYVKY